MPSKRKPPAYKRAIAATCLWCSSLAQYEVFNTHNASMGKFCTSCADRSVQALNEAEARMRAERDGDGYD